MANDLEISMLANTVDGRWQIELTAKARSAEAADSLIKILEEVKPLLAENALAPATPGRQT